MGRQIDVLTSWATSFARLGLGSVANRRARRAPLRPLELYEFEVCPYCRKVRDTLVALDLDVMILPCPKGGTRHRPVVKKLGGRHQFPFLVDPNANVAMYESNDIIDHLFSRYGDGRPGVMLRFPPLTNTTSYVASAFRAKRGRQARRSRMPRRPLELYSFESSPYSRLVREVLCELELPYFLRNVGKGSPVDWIPAHLARRLSIERAPSTEKRKAFVTRSGKMMVPYLVDPNENVEMFESADICRYLEETYAE